MTSSQRLLGCACIFPTGHLLINFRSKACTSANNAIAGSRFFACIFSPVIPIPAWKIIQYKHLFIDRLITIWTYHVKITAYFPWRHACCLIFSAQPCCLNRFLFPRCGRWVKRVNISVRYNIVGHYNIKPGNYLLSLDYINAPGALNRIFSCPLK